MGTRIDIPPLSIAYPSISARFMQVSKNSFSFQLMCNYLHMCAYVWHSVGASRPVKHTYAATLWSSSFTSADSGSSQCGHFLGRPFFPATRCPHTLHFKSVTRQRHLLFLISACSSKYFQTRLFLLRPENSLIKLDILIKTKIGNRKSDKFESKITHKLETEKANM